MDLVSVYTRAQAIEDGVLIDVSDTREAKECGIRFPIAVTRAVWDNYIKVPKGVKFQDQHARLWDILFMLRHAIKTSPPSTDRILFQLHVRNDNLERTPPLVTLKALCHPDDHAEPVITIMRLDED